MQLQINTKLNDPVLWNEAIYCFPNEINYVNGLCKAIRLHDLHISYFKCKTK